VLWNHDDKERKAAPRGQSLFKLLIISSLLSPSLPFPSLPFSSPSYVAWGRAGGNSTRLWNQQPSSPPSACQRWMDGRIGGMNGWVNEWMDGWTGSYTFFHLIAISLNPMPNAQVCVYLMVHITKLQVQTTFPKPLYIPHSTCIHGDPGRWKSWCLHCLWPVR
jgi:hypothetical protein